MTGRIIYFDGADFAGKTTSCAMMRDRILADTPDAAIAMIHFPIRDLASDIKMLNTDIQPNIFYLCGKFNGKNITEIQDIIAENIEANSWIIKQLYVQGFNIIVDRYVFSNIIYRQLYCPESLTLSQFYAKYPRSADVMTITECHILTPDISELLRRKNLRYSSNTPENGSIDELNEEDENIKRASDLFHKYSTYCHSSRS